MPRAPLVLFGVPTYGNFSTEWVIAKTQLMTPLGAGHVDYYVPGPESIAAKRNAIIQAALDNNVRYVFFLGDDNIPPPNAFMTMYQHMQNDPGIKIVTGLYVSRTNPPEPMIWRDYLQGSYYDFRVGEFFPVDWAGCDCMLIDTSIFRNIPRPWFSQDYIFGDGQAVPAGVSTEDIYFYEKARAHGIQAWCDSGILCGHQDRDTRQFFQIPVDWPQWTKRPGQIIKAPGTGGLQIADVGCGYASPYSEHTVTRIDSNEEVHPDIRCQLTAIPEPDQTYDQVWARYVLQKFTLDQAGPLIREWTRILKIGGTLHITVPNIEAAMRAILSQPIASDAWDSIYGHNDDYRNGFTRRVLIKKLATAWGLEAIHGVDGEGNEVAAVGCFEEAAMLLEEVDGGSGIKVTATKVVHPKAVTIGVEGRYGHMYDHEDEAQLEENGHAYVSLEPTPGVVKYTAEVEGGRPISIHATPQGIEELRASGTFTNGIGQPTLAEPPLSSIISDEDNLPTPLDQPNA